MAHGVRAGGRRARLARDAAVLFANHYTHSAWGWSRNIKARLVHGQRKGNAKTLGKNNRGSPGCSSIIPAGFTRHRTSQLHPLNARLGVRSERDQRSAPYKVAVETVWRQIFCWWKPVAEKNENYRDGTAEEHAGFCWRGLSGAQ